MKEIEYEFIPKITNKPGIRIENNQIVIPKEEQVKFDSGVSYKMILDLRFTNSRYNQIPTDDLKFYSLIFDLTF